MFHRISFCRWFLLFSTTYVHSNMIICCERGIARARIVDLLQSSALHLLEDWILRTEHDAWSKLVQGLQPRWYRGARCRPTLKVKNSLVRGLVNVVAVQSKLLTECKASLYKSCQCWNGSLSVFNPSLIVCHNVWFKCSTCLFPAGL